MRVVLLIRCLVRGGAERQLVTLAKGLRRLGHEVSVVVFYDQGDLKAELEACAVPVENLDKRGRWDVLPFLWRLRSRLRALRPDVVYGCLAGANICAVVVRPFLPVRPAVAIRIAASFVNLADYDLTARLSYWIEARIARFSDVVIANSRKGARHAVDRGFPASRMMVVPNGFDTQYFKRDPRGRTAFRRCWNVPDGCRLIGLVARLDPIKDHQTFLDAAARTAARRDDVRFVCVGAGEAAHERQLRAAADRLGLSERLVWAGETRDLPAVYSALDLATCSSYGEGMPNVVGEAMACEVPCVVTDVGDAAWLVGETGEVVPPRCPAALADGWDRMLERIDRQGRETGRRARQRIRTKLSEDRLITHTAEVLQRLVSDSEEPAGGDAA